MPATEAGHRGVTKSRALWRSCVTLKLESELSRWFRASVLASNPLGADYVATGRVAEASEARHVVKLRGA